MPLRVLRTVGARVTSPPPVQQRPARERFLEGHARDERAVRGAHGFGDRQVRLPRQRREPEQLGAQRFWGAEPGAEARPGIGTFDPLDGGKKVVQPQDEATRARGIDPEDLLEPGAKGHDPGAA